MEVNIRSKKFGEIIFQIDDEDYKIIENRKIYASKMNNEKLENIIRLKELNEDLNND